MATDNQLIAPRGSPAASAAEPLSLSTDAAVEITAESFRDSFGEDLHRTLDLDTWHAGQDLSQEYSRIEAMVNEAVEQEGQLQKRIRDEVFPRISAENGGPSCAGVKAATLDAIEHVHSGLLFNGGVEACDGTHQVHDTLPLTIHQIGVSLVSYRGDQGTWYQRLFRRDLRVRGEDPVDEVLRVLAKRDRRGGLNQPSSRDALSEMARRAIMTHAERAILLHRSNATWRMGHGNPAPWELLTGAGSLDLMIEATKVLRQLVEGHQKFVFVASEPSERMLLTIGQALRPLEYAIVGTLHERMEKMVEGGHYRMRVTSDTTWDGEKLKPADWIRRFRDQIGPQIVVGLYRATSIAPAQLFYAHVNHADLAAHIVLADSVLQEHRGFPLLIDLADHVCTSVFGGDSLTGLTSTAYASAGAPWRYLSERSTRRK